MEETNIEQNTDEWLEERKKYVGGSDVASVLGISPWKTRFRLWQEKKGYVQPKSNTFIFQKGHALEDRSRVLYELIYDIDVPPKVVRHKDYEFAQVSLDGYNAEHRRVVEFKFVGEDAFDKTVNEDYVPPHYYCQLQYQMFCTGFDEVDFVVYSEKRDKIHKLKVKADLSYIARMIAHCEEFHWEVKNNIPPRLVDGDYKQVRKATIRRTVESLKKMLQEEYGDATFFRWDGIYMEIKE